jgi:cyanate lyase
MNKTEMKAAILDAKKKKKTTWAEIAKSAGLSEVHSPA